MGESGDLEVFGEAVDLEVGVEDVVIDEDLLGRRVSSWLWWEVFDDNEFGLFELWRWWRSEDAWGDSGRAVGTHVNGILGDVEAAVVESAVTGVDGGVAGMFGRSLAPDSEGA